MHNITIEKQFSLRLRLSQLEFETVVAFSEDNFI